MKGERTEQKAGEQEIQNQDKSRDAVRSVSLVKLVESKSSIVVKKAK